MQIIQKSFVLCKLMQVMICSYFVSFICKPPPKMGPFSHSYCFTCNICFNFKSSCSNNQMGYQAMDSYRGSIWIWIQISIQSASHYWRWREEFFHCIFVYTLSATLRKDLRAKFINKLKSSEESDNSWNWNAAKVSRCFRKGYRCQITMNHFFVFWALGKNKNWSHVILL